MRIIREYFLLLSKNNIYYIPLFITLVAISYIVFKFACFIRDSFENKKQSYLINATRHLLNKTSINCKVLLGQTIISQFLTEYYSKNNSSKKHKRIFKKIILTGNFENESDPQKVNIMIEKSLLCIAPVITPEAIKSILDNTMINVYKKILIDLKSLDNINDSNEKEEICLCLLSTSEAITTLKEMYNLYNNMLTS